MKTLRELKRSAQEEELRYLRADEELERAMLLIKETDAYRQYLISQAFFEVARNNFLVAREEYLAEKIAVREFKDESL